MTFRDSSPDDRSIVEGLVGRVLLGRFAVVLRRLDGSPVVIENEPHLRDGTPMPTLFWLVDPSLHADVSRLEGNGGVHRFEDLVDADALARTHEAYAERRREATVRRDLVQARGGVGGTSKGVKCLHAHLAHFLVGGFDPVGELVARDVSFATFCVEDVRD